MSETKVFIKYVKRDNGEKYICAEIHKFENPKLIYLSGWVRIKQKPTPKELEVLNKISSANDTYISFPERECIVEDLSLITI